MTPWNVYSRRPKPGAKWEFYRKCRSQGEAKLVMGNLRSKNIQAKMEPAE